MGGYASRNMQFAYTPNTVPPSRIISRPISKLDKRQQWKLILNPDKKTFTMKNIDNNTYLYISQEPREGLSEYTTIDLDNNNYQFDPAFSNISETEVVIGTTFSFISSFGTQLDIIDKDTIKNDVNAGLLKSIKGTRIRLSHSNPNKSLNIFGVFIYSPEGKVINTNKEFAYSSSSYFRLNTGGIGWMGFSVTSYPASNAIKIVEENSTRTASEALKNSRLSNTKPNIGWNTWENSSDYCAHTMNDTPGGEWWEYEFSNEVDISLIEIFGRIGYPETIKNVKIELFNDTVSRTKVLWTISFGGVNNNAHKAIMLVPD